MRPQRSAALAAKQSIAQTAALDIADADEGNAAKAKAITEAGPDDDYAPEQLSKRARLLSEYEKDKYDDRLYLVSANHLPTELKQQIIGPVEAGGNGLGPSTIGEQAWEKRVKGYMKARKRSPGCLTYRETFARLIRHRCLSCLGETQAKYGLIWPEGPDWAVVCAYCQHRKGGCYEVMVEKDANALGLTDDDLLEIPCKYYKSCRGSPWTFEYRKEAVLRLLQEKQEQVLDKLDDILDAYTGESSLSTLRIAITGVLYEPIPYSYRLRNMVNKLFCLDEVTNKHLDEVIKLYLKLWQIEKDVEQGLKRGQIVLQSYDPKIGDRMYEHAHTTWLDALLGRKVFGRTYAVQDYIDAIRRARAVREATQRFGA